MKTLFRQNADIPLALVSAHPGYECALQIAVILIAYVPFDELAVEQFLIRADSGYLDTR